MIVPATILSPRMSNTVFVEEYKSQSMCINAQLSFLSLIKSGKDSSNQPLTRHTFDFTSGRFSFLKQP